MVNKLKDMDITNYTPKGDLEGLPIRVIKQMLIEQVAQGNKEDVTVFERDKNATEDDGGFTRGNTKLRYKGWENALIDKDFTEFDKVYPNTNTKPYPKMMLVWDNEREKPVKDKIQGEFQGRYLSWCNTDGVYIPWNFAKDIEEN